MWFFAGFNKLLSPVFLDHTAQWIVTGIVAHPPPWLSQHAGYLIALSELSIGVLALLPWTRKLAAIAAFGLHVGILWDLSPVGLDWNISVWPWNVALALAGFALIATWREPPRASLAVCCAWLRPLVLLLMISPLGFYVGVTDAYLAHNLYSSNTARAKLQCAGTCDPDQDLGLTWQVFNVPLPPEHRIFRQYFAEACHPGDVLTITDSRWWFLRQGLGEQRIACPARSR